MKKILLALLFVAMLAVMSTAEIVLEYWTGFTGPDGRFMQLLVDRFNQEYAGQIKVNMSTMLWGDYYTKLPISLASAMGPDVGIVHIDSIRNIADQGMIIPLDDYLDVMDIEVGDIVPSVWEAAQVEGLQYGVPLDIHPLTFYWNKDLFAEAGLDPENPPNSREEFLEAARLLTKDTTGDGRIDQWGTMIPIGWPNYFLWFSIFYSNEGVLFNEDNTEPLFGSPEGIDTMQFLVDLIYKHEVSPRNVEVDAPVDAFKRGELAMEFNGIWMLTGFMDVEDLNFGAGPIPQLGSEVPAQWGGSHTMTIFRQRRPDSAKINAAATFIGWISEHSFEWASAGQIPASIIAQQSEEFQNLPHMASIAAGAGNTVFPPFFALYGDATGPIWEALNLAILGQKTVEQALRDAVNISLQVLQE